MRITMVSGCELGIVADRLLSLVGDDDRGDQLKTALLPFHRMGQQCWLEEHRRQSHVIKIRIVGPIHWQRTHRLIEGRVRPNKSEHGLRSSTARHSTSTQMQRHEPSRKTLAAFACVTPASLLTLQPPDNFVATGSTHRDIQAHVRAADTEAVDYCRSRSLISNSA